MTIVPPLVTLSTEMRSAEQALPRRHKRSTMCYGFGLSLFVSASVMSCDGISQADLTRTEEKMRKGLTAVSKANHDSTRKVISWVQESFDKAKAASTKTIAMIQNKHNALSEDVVRMGFVSDFSHQFLLETIRSVLYKLESDTLTSTIRAKFNEMRIRRVSVISAFERSVRFIGATQKCVHEGLKDCTELQLMMSQYDPNLMKLLSMNIKLNFTVQKVNDREGSSLVMSYISPENVVYNEALLGFSPSVAFATDCSPLEDSGLFFCKKCLNQKEAWIQPSTWAHNVTISVGRFSESDFRSCISSYPTDYYCIQAKGRFLTLTKSGVSVSLVKLRSSDECHIWRSEDMDLSIISSELEWKQDETVLHYRGISGEEINEVMKLDIDSKQIIEDVETSHRVALDMIDTLQSKESTSSWKLTLIIVIALVIMIIVSFLIYHHMFGKTSLKPGMEPDKETDASMTVLILANKGERIKVSAFHHGSCTMEKSGSKLSCSAIHDCGLKWDFGVEITDLLKHTRVFTGSDMVGSAVIVTTFAAFAHRDQLFDWASSLAPEEEMIEDNFLVFKEDADHELEDVRSRMEGIPGPGSELMKMRILHNIGLK